MAASIDPVLPAVVFAGFEHLSSSKDKIEYFWDLFNVPLTDRAQYRPLLLVSNFSRSGEVAESFGLFVKEGNLFEVHGSECSVWDFDGQWEPEATTVESLRHRLDMGRLGQDPDHPFHEPLRSLLDHLQLINSLRSVYPTLPNSPPRKI